VLYKIVDFFKLKEEGRFILRYIFDDVSCDTLGDDILKVHVSIPEEKRRGVVGNYPLVSRLCSTVDEAVHVGRFMGSVREMGRKSFPACLAILNRTTALIRMAGVALVIPDYLVKFWF